MEYKPREKPTEPGFYLVMHQEDEPYLVRLCVETDSHNMFFVMLDDDEEKYPVDIWAGCVWYGPLNDQDRKSFEVLVARREREK